MINLLGAFIVGVVLLAIWRHGEGFQAFEDRLKRQPTFLVAPLFIVLGLVVFLMVFDRAGQSMPVLRWIGEFIGAANIWVHEAGHGFLYFAPYFLLSAGGTLLEVGLPLGIALFCWRRGHLYTLSFTLLWLSLAVGSMALYVGDASAMKLELLGGESGTHDWNYMLGKLGLLRFDQDLSQATYVVGAVTMALACIAFLSAVQRN